MPTNAEKRKRKKLKEARERIRQRKVIIIPPKNDISLFQMQNCIESLPIPVFKIIQEYSESEMDYRNLMNTNLSTFQPIKSETVKYSLLGPGRWIRMNHYKTEYKEASLINIIKGVKDKSKQISLSFWKVFQPTVIKYAHLFEGIKKFHLVAADSHLCRFTEQLSLDIFSNIHYLILEKIIGIPSLGSGLKNVEKLELLRCGFIDIPEVNPTATLKELKIITAGHLNMPCSLDNISKIHLECKSFERNVVNFPKNCRNLELRCLARVEMRFSDSPFDDNLAYEKLKCSGFSLVNCPTILILQRYPVIELENFYDRTPFPQFPVLHVREIVLRRFSLASWNSQTIINLKHLHFWRCTNLIKIPDMPQVETVVLELCNRFTEIPSLPSLQKLTLRSCVTVKNICYCPELKEADFDNCASLENFSSCRQVPSLRISRGSRNADFMSLEEIQESMDLVNKRALSIASFQSLRVFTFCKNIYQVELSYLDGLVDCKGIMNIHHLKITSCYSFVSTEGLQNIAGSVTIKSCYSLGCLTGLRNVPEVTLNVCDRCDFTGLGNHEKLTVHGYLTAFKRFLKENPNIFKTIRNLIIG
jgi:hypothetical protein